MAPVTVDSSAQNAYYSAGNVGWSARSVFAYRTALQVLDSSGGGTTNMGNADATTRFAQSFSPTSAIDVTAIRVALRKISAPTDNVTLEIHSDSGSSTPSGTVLATSATTLNGANVTTTVTWHEFVFTTPVSLSASTKYWFVIKRSGSNDATNYYRFTTASKYASHGNSTYTLSTTTWGAESAADAMFQIIQEIPVALYHVTQDTSLHVWKSTDDGASWSEQDSGDAPTVTNANYPFDAHNPRTGPYIVTGRMTGTNAAAIRVFNMSTDSWDTSDYGTTGAPSTVSNERSIRVSSENTFITAAPGQLEVVFTDSTDDADIARHRILGAAVSWGSKQNIAALTSAEASLVSDVVTDSTAPGFSHIFHYDCAADDFTDISMTGNTAGTALDLATSAADVETEHASATFQPYLNGSGVTTIIAAFIDAGGTIQERIANLDVTSASVTLASDNAVSAATTAAGRQLSTCRYDGTNYIFAAVSGTAIEYYESTVAGTWGSAVSHLSGGTAIVLSQAIAIEGYGLGIVYTDNGNATFDWVIAPAVGDVTVNAVTGTATAAALVPGVAATATVSPPVATATAAALVPTVTATVDASVAPPVATATALANAPTVAADATVSAPVATATAEALVPTVTTSADVTTNAPTATATATALVPAVAADARIEPPAATATALANAPTLSAVATIAAPVATATATAHAPVLTATATVEPPVATATATAFAPDVSVDSAVLVQPPTATATATALTPALLADAMILAVVAAATAQMYAPTVTGVANATVAAPLATATAQAFAPAVSASSTVEAPTATALANAPTPAVIADALIVAVAATATAQAYAPSVTAFVPIGGLTGRIETTAHLQARLVVEPYLSATNTVTASLQGRLEPTATLSATVEPDAELTGRMEIT